MEHVSKYVHVNMDNQQTHAQLMAPNYAQHAASEQDPTPPGHAKYALVALGTITPLALPTPMEERVLKVTVASEEVSTPTPTPQTTVTYVAPSETTIVIEMNTHNAHHATLVKACS